ncbi:putative Intraflagellar transport 140 [Monocercomonoides exilis]|uniref:putative Intraflagellar transport 140 n=1 Tax=Monocercomonoides exilis TaxID=2049356 RepID=UPI003559E0C2|nr:putative Intraflagellar transport 140 [Monocercomonoides exilis]|eukprot:MONOS_4990.1-p1 / transcript=MONOS_4990.1 / gene=MONOS_4990 / organism=Monocercomonoides_exilis_PA203 / gene_product=Intraflagellar transport 140 homolog / transcript_product=Intraflagellar transport 140 homolog / location=Mono_scaffold00140:18853-24240(+) / protein_length=1602 / sequence_SO=supercontig / SO=protein_coding / is_pseudo=false
MPKNFHTSWRNLTCGAFHTLAQIYAIGLGSERKVVICNDEGTSIFDFSCDSTPTKCSWDPNHTVLITGCEDGKIYLFHHKKIKTYDEQHQNPIDSIVWDLSGSRILTGDRAGDICLWQMEDTEGTERDMFPILKYNLSSAVVSSVFRSPLPPADPSRVPATQFVSVTADGNVFYIDEDEDHYTCIGSQLSGPPQSILYSPTKDSAVLLMQNLMMYTFDLSILDGASPQTTTIASSTPDAVLRDSCWVSQSTSLLCILADEPFVRLLNLDTGDNYILDTPKTVKRKQTNTLSNPSGTASPAPSASSTPSPSSASTSSEFSSSQSNSTITVSTRESFITQDDPFITVAFEEHTRSLIAATASGKACVWRFYPDEANAVNDSKGAKGFSPSSSSASSSASASSGTYTTAFEEGIGNNDDEVVLASGAECWELCETHEIEQPVESIHWGPGPLGRIYGALCNRGVTTVKHTEHKAVMSESVAAIQTGGKEVALEHLGQSSIKLNTGVKVAGLTLDAKRMIVWSGKAVECYNINPSNSGDDEDDDSSMARRSSFSSGGSGDASSGVFINGSGSTNAKLAPRLPILETRFDFQSQSIAVKGQSLYICSEQNVYVTNLKGTIKQSLPFAADEGEPVCLGLSAKGDHLAVGSKQGTVKVLDVSGPEAVLSTAPWRFTKGAPVSLVVSANGSAVSVQCLVAPEEMNDASVQQLSRATIPDTRIHVYSVDRGSLFSYDFLPINCYPIAHLWDLHDPRFFCVALKKLIRDPIDGKWHDSRDRHLEIATMFFSKDKGILLSDRFTMKEQHQTLLGCSIPYLFFSVRSTGMERGQQLVEREIMREYEGLSSPDVATLTAMRDFTFNLTMGNMDEAYKNVRAIKSTQMWENMARLCVKTRRLDIMEICLRNMGHIRGMIALREARAEPQPEAQLAMVAIQLGLYDEAEKLMKECNRWDLVNKYYQWSGKWTNALKIAKEKDRIHLSSTHHLYAQHLESTGNVVGAIQHYEEANTSDTEVVRLLYFSGRSSDLKRFLDVTESPQAKAQWGQICESEGRGEEALKYYRQGNAILPLVRLLCYMGRTDEAEKVVMESKDTLAAQHLAQVMEKNGQISKAINLYAACGRHLKALKLAMVLENEGGYVSGGWDEADGKGRESENGVMMLALKGTKQGMVEAGKFYEEKAMFEKAFTLYRRAGALNEAIDVCFKGNLTESLHQIADDISSDADPTLLVQCAKFFVSIDKFDKAINMLCAAGEFDTIFDLCSSRNIRLTDELAQRIEDAINSKLAPEQPGEDGDDQDSEEIERAESPFGPSQRLQRNPFQISQHQKQQYLHSMATVLHTQQSYQTAAKYFTDSGDLTSACNSLISSGNMEKVIAFANLCREEKVYVMVGNYLERLEWRSKPEILKYIVQMYQKGKAMDALVAFYESCAQVEIDEYLEYEKALMALREAMRYQRLSQSPDKAQRVTSLARRISLVELFLKAKELEPTDPMEMVRMLKMLLSEEDVEQAVRTGDIYAQLIQHFHAVHQMDDAFSLLQEMSQRGIMVGPYLERELIDQICQFKGVTPESIGIMDEMADAGNTQSSANEGGQFAGSNDQMMEEDEHEEAEEWVDDDE